jgi:hypothetical protein
MNMFIAQIGARTVNINEIALLGVGAVVVVMILAVLSQVGLSYLAQRNLNDQLSLGIQGIVGSNNLRAIDNQMDDYREPRDGDSGKEGN